MKSLNSVRKLNLGAVLSGFIPLLLFWVILASKIPYSFTKIFSSYSLVLFLLVLAAYYFSFRLPGYYGTLAVFSLTMVLFALILSYKWTSGYSYTGIIGGFLPYKDGKNYYYGANLILEGLPLGDTSNAAWRPLFPGFMSALLMLAGNNLKLTVAILVALTGFSLYLLIRQVHKSLGALPASLYGTFLYIYIQKYIGLFTSESFGFAVGCLAFLLLWRVALTPKWPNLVLGLFALLVAVSARAGAFFVFPLLIVWSGLAFRGERKFSYHGAAIASIVVLIGYYLLNTAYGRLLGAETGAAFGNFAFHVYGQVHGGTGWHSAIEDLGKSDTRLVYQATWRFFLAHPLSLLIGIIKSYRDFFLPFPGGVFPFRMPGQIEWLDLGAWVCAMILMFRGFILLIRSIRLNLSSLLVAGFIGIFLSIPFLPPIDGGPRFHASTMPLFLALFAVAACRSYSDKAQAELPDEPMTGEFTVSFLGLIVLLALTLVVPIVTYSSKSSVSHTVPECPSEQVPFVAQFHPQSYIDILPQGTACGIVPEICINDFDRNGLEKTADDFYQDLLARSQSSESGIRVIPAINLLDAKFRYFIMSYDQALNLSSSGMFSGCAVEFSTTNQRIYQVESYQKVVD